MPIIQVKYLIISVKSSSYGKVAMAYINMYVLEIPATSIL